MILSAKKEFCISFLKLILVTFSFLLFATVRKITGYGGDNSHPYLVSEIYLMFLVSLNRVSAFVSDTFII